MEIGVPSQNWDRKTSKYVDSDITAYIWSGTCDLTQKGENSKVSLVQKDIDHIVQKLRETKEFLERKGVKVVLLEVTNYSIVRWNEQRGHTTTEATIEEDRQLQAKIKQINSQIEEINLESNCTAPKFNTDLQRSRTLRHQTEYYTNWKLLPDGIHPGPQVARVWLLKIINNFLQK